MSQDTINLEELENEIEAIKSRNKRVEADKAWETSFSRKIMIAVLTYFWRNFCVRDDFVIVN